MEEMNNGLPNNSNVDFNANSSLSSMGKEVLLNSLAAYTSQGVQTNALTGLTAIIGAMKFLPLNPVASLIPGSIAAQGAAIGGGLIGKTIFNITLILFSINIANKVKNFVKHNILLYIYNSKIEDFHKLKGPKWFSDISSPSEISEESLMKATGIRSKYALNRALNIYIERHVAIRVSHFKEAGDVENVKSFFDYMAQWVEEKQLLQNENPSEDKKDVKVMSKLAQKNTPITKSLMTLSLEEKLVFFKCVAKFESERPDAKEHNVNIDKIEKFNIETVSDWGNGVFQCIGFSRSLKPKVINIRFNRVGDLQKELTLSSNIVNESRFHRNYQEAARQIATLSHKFVNSLPEDIRINVDCRKISPVIKIDNSSAEFIILPATIEDTQYDSRTNVRFMFDIVSKTLYTEESENVFLPKRDENSFVPNKEGYVLSETYQNNVARYSLRKELVASSKEINISLTNKEHPITFPKGVEPRNVENVKALLKKFLISTKILRRAFKEKEAGVFSREVNIMPSEFKVSLKASKDRKKIIISCDEEDFCCTEVNTNRLVMHVKGVEYSVDILSSGEFFVQQLKGNSESNIVKVTVDLESKSKEQKFKNTVQEKNEFYKDGYVKNLSQVPVCMSNTYAFTGESIKKCSVTIDPNGKNSVIGDEKLNEKLSEFKASVNASNKGNFETTPLGLAFKTSETDTSSVSKRVQVNETHLKDSLSKLKASSNSVVTIEGSKVFLEEHLVPTVLQKWGEERVDETMLNALSNHLTKDALASVKHMTRFAMLFKYGRVINFSFPQKVTLSLVGEENVILQEQKEFSVNEIMKAEILRTVFAISKHPEKMQHALEYINGEQKSFQEKNEETIKVLKTRESSLLNRIAAKEKVQKKKTKHTKEKVSVSYNKTDEEKSKDMPKHNSTDEEKANEILLEEKEALKDISEQKQKVSSLIEGSKSISELLTIFNKAIMTSVADRNESEAFANLLQKFSRYPEFGTLLVIIDSIAQKSSIMSEKQAFAEKYFDIEKMLDHFQSPSAFL